MSFDITYVSDTTMLTTNSTNTETYSIFMCTECENQNRHSIVNDDEIIGYWICDALHCQLCIDCCNAGFEEVNE